MEEHVEYLFSIVGHWPGVPKKPSKVFPGGAAKNGFYNDGPEEFGRIVHRAYRSLEDFVEEHNAEVLSSNSARKEGRIHFQGFCPCCYGGWPWEKRYNDARAKRRETDVFVSPIGGTYSDTGSDPSRVFFRELGKLPRDYVRAYKYRARCWNADRIFGGPSRMPSKEGFTSVSGIGLVESDFRKWELELEKRYADHFITSVKRVLSEKGMYPPYGQLSLPLRRWGEKVEEKS